MSSTLLPAVIPPPPSADLAVSDTLKSALEAAQRFVSMATASNTVKAYSADWADFARWCATEHLQALPAQPETVGLYIASLADTHKVSTIARRLAAIAKRHRNAGFDSPASMKHSAVHNVISGMRRDRGTRPDAKRALSTDELRCMVTAIPATPHGLRDRALLLIGFCGGFRRSELAAIDFSDVEDGDEGLKILIRRSKTDQEGEGRQVGIPYGSDPKTCPVRAYRKWIATACITEGPVFRAFRNRTMMADGITDQVVARIVKKSAERVGIPANVLGGHSLRSGLATTAARNGASEASIMRQTGHKSVQMVRRYIHEGSVFHDNAGAKLGL
jgi:site-specific recombinase XerD